ncbi:MAG: HD-GYP domain-containing protein [Dehalococcoidia bacterium]|nr:HD-GYP domain-containing protein [Dehalococcoidia bacterium]
MAEVEAPSEDEPRQSTSVQLAEESVARDSHWLTPARQFYLALATACVVGTIAISLSVGFLIQQFLFGETRDVTAAAVNLHFRSVFGDDIFSRPLSTTELQRFDRMVRDEFDMYDIVQVKLYRPDGHISFSYVPELINEQSPEGLMFDSLRRALAGEVIMDQEELSREDNDRGRDFPAVFEIYIPVWTNGQVVGVAEVYRNVEDLLANLRRIQLFVTASVVVVSLVFFFSLGQIYRNSTRKISAQSIALRRALKEIESTYNQTLESLSAVLDGRDAETEGHSRRVSEYTARIARQMGISGLALEKMCQGALLHDIGKMSVSDAILTKPGPLSQDEWVEMRKHSDFGYRMLEHIAFLRAALPVVLHHHERFDGNGYPARLKGDDIPLGARIFSVADSFDAMTSNRPYRRAMPLETAREEIRRNSGTQFDPKTVEAFQAIPDGEWARIAREVSAKRDSV